MDRSRLKTPKILNISEINQKHDSMQKPAKLFLDIAINER